MPKDYILALDNGTQSVRALLFDAEGNLAAKSRIPIEPYVSPQPGWAEHDPDYFWKALCAACQQLWTLTDIPKDAIAGVVLTTQRATMINLDKYGKPLRPAIIWLDQRRASNQPRIGGRWGLLFRLARVSQTVAFFQAEAEANWIAQHQPGIWEKTHKFLLLSGYLTYRLTGRFVDSIGSQVGYIPFDSKTMHWAAPDDWKWLAIAAMTPDRLPDLVPPGTPIGIITSEAAAATGIPAGTPFIAAAADKACEVLGAGSMQGHIGCVSYGTTATITTTSRKYVEPIPLVPPYPAAVPGMYSLEIQNYRGYWLVNWFKEEFAHHEQRLAQERGIEAEELFDELVNATPPGAMGLMLQPYWTPGVRFPGPEAKGAVIGFGDVHTRAHLYRAILEGLAYALRQGSERIEKRSGIKIMELRVSGGGSQSDAAVQLTADMFNLPTARPHIYETSGLGAAIDGAVGLKWHPDFRTAVGAMTRISRVFEPNEQHHALYTQLYERVYKQMYARLQPLYREIQAITGYPGGLE